MMIHICFRSFIFCTFEEKIKFGIRFFFEEYSLSIKLIKLVGVVVFLSLHDSIQFLEV
jgi:hypothetical protein